MATKDGVITTENTLIQLNKVFTLAHDKLNRLKSHATEKATHTVVHLDLHDATEENNNSEQLKRKHSYEGKTFKRKRKSKPDYEASNTTMQCQAKNNSAKSIGKRAKSPLKTVNGYVELNLIDFAAYDDVTLTDIICVNLD